MLLKMQIEIAEKQIKTYQILTNLSYRVFIICRETVKIGQLIIALVNENPMETLKIIGMVSVLIAVYLFIRCLLIPTVS